MHCYQLILWSYTPGTRATEVVFVITPDFNLHLYNDFLVSKKGASDGNLKKGRLYNNFILHDACSIEK